MSPPTIQQAARPLRVLTFTTLFPNNVWPNHGVFVKERLVQVARRGDCEVRVVAPVPWYPPLGLGWRRRYRQVARHETIEGLPVLHPRYAMTPKVGMATYGWVLYRAVLGPLRRIRAEFAFDLIDAHYAYPDGVAAARVGRALGVPVVLTVRGSDINLFSNFPLVRRQLRRTLAEVARVVAVSGALAEKIRGLGVPAERIEVIPNGVDPGKFHPCSREHARARLGLPAGIWLLGVGNLVPLKGFDLLVEALHRLRQAGRADLGLAIVGDGPEREPLLRLVRERGLEERVRLVGPVPHEAVGDWYAAADLFCLASSREGWPNVVLEALACGLPVVATRVGGLPEIIRSERLGLLVERDPDALAAAIDRALLMPWDRAALVEHALTHGWERVAESVVRVFAEATGSTGDRAAVQALRA